MATKRQEKVIEVMIEARKEGKTLTGKEILKRADYSKGALVQPGRVFNSKGIQELINKYGLQSIIDKTFKEALSDKDKRNATANRRIILELADAFPDKKVRLGAIDQRNTLLEDNV